MQLLNTQRIIANGLGQLHFEELWPSLHGHPPTAALLDGLFAPKLLELRRLVEALVLDQGRKVVIFSQWRRMLKLADWAISDLLAACGKRALFFTGAESSKLRTQSLVDFHDDPQATVLFLTDAGGVGLNLQHASNACINLELPWNPAVLEQRIGRIYRLGQKRPIDVFNLVAEASLESRIAAVVSSKQVLFKGVFDGTTNEVRFDSAASFATEVQRLLDATIPSAPVAPSSESLAPDAPPEDMSKICRIFRMQRHQSIRKRPTLVLCRQVRRPCPQNRRHQPKLYPPQPYKSRSAWPRRLTTSTSCLVS